MKNHSHASRIPSLDQSPSCHSAEWKTPLFAMPNIIDSHDMGLRTVLQSRRPKENAYSTCTWSTLFGWRRPEKARNKADVKSFASRPLLHRLILVLGRGVQDSIFDVAVLNDILNLFRRLMMLTRVQLPSYQSYEAPTCITKFTLTGSRIQKRAPKVFLIQVPFKTSYASGY
ncbi:hypothetical protein TNCV_862101 [Trichonephila clavipes]|nr:hypothetical protein TNCV_862101 [Trichonephila clavipes]